MKTESRMFSLAYFEDVAGWETNNNFESVDFHSSGLINQKISHLSSLVRFRASQCDRVESLVFESLENLRSIDLSNCPNLQSIKIFGCPKLTSLDLSKDSNLQTIEGDFPSLQYLSVPHTNLTKYPICKGLLYLDVSFSKISVDVLKTFKKLELLVAKQSLWPSPPCLSEISNIKIAIIEAQDFCYDKNKWFSKIQVLDLSNCSNIHGNFDASEKIYIIENSRNEIKTHGNSPVFSKPLQFFTSISDFYGPWPLPPVDNITNTPTQFQNLIPDCNTETVIDSVLGAIYGFAIGDMIGLGGQGFSSQFAKLLFSNTFSIEWSQPIRSELSMEFLHGSFSHHTQNLVLLMQSLTHSILSSSGEEIRPFYYIDLKDYAHRLLSWKAEGFSQHKQKHGIILDDVTKSALEAPGFEDDPLCDKTCKDPTNSCIFRAVTIGCLVFWDEEAVQKAAISFTKVTHQNPICVFSTVFIALLISKIIRERVGMIDTVDLSSTIDQAIDAVPEIAEYVSIIHTQDDVDRIDDLSLDSCPTNLALKSFGAAVWCFKNCSTYQSTIETVIKEGGDSSLNCAVVGAIFGAKQGFGKLPSDCLLKLADGHWLYNECRSFCGLMGLTLPPSLWKKE